MNLFRKLLKPKSEQPEKSPVPPEKVDAAASGTATSEVSDDPTLAPAQAEIAEAQVESTAAQNGVGDHAPEDEQITGFINAASLESLIIEPQAEEDSLEATGPQEAVVVKMDVFEEEPPTPRATAPLPSTGELMNSVVDGATRPLPQDAILEFSPLTHAAFGEATDVGRMRTNNQDSAFTFFAASRSVDEIPDFGIFIVADGMGGHQNGEKASAITTRTVATHVLDTIYHPIVSRHGKNNDAPIAESLASAIQKANIEVMANVPEGGTTLSTAIVIGDRAYIAHVGDSRIYLFHHGILEKLTRDHSLVQRLIELDQITTEEAADHPQKNVLYRALGQNEVVEVDTLTKRLPPGAMLLLCSDGLWNQVSDSEITEVIAHVRNPQEACQKLISMANAHGGIDNVTVILLQLPG